MLHIIIFSFNRAAQLDILLNSLFKYWEQPNIYVSVLYNTSSVQLEKGYELLKKKTQKNKWPVIFYKEKDDFKGYTIKEKLNPINFYRLLKYKYIRSPRTDFRAQLLSLLNDNQSELVMFLTDDAEFISPVSISSANINWLLDNPLGHQFSLRLGHGMDNEPTSIIDEGIDYLEWNFSSAS